MKLVASIPARIERGLYFFSTQGGTINTTITLYDRSPEVVADMSSVSDTHGTVYLPECTMEFTGTGDLVLEPVATDRR